MKPKPLASLSTNTPSLCEVILPMICQKDFMPTCAQLFLSKQQASNYAGLSKKCGFGSSHE